MTGTIQNAASQVIVDLKHDSLQQGYLNSQGAALKAGDEVYLHTDGSVKLRSTGAQIPIGIVVVGGDDGTRVTVRSFFTAVMDVYNGGVGAINAGVKVVPLGTKVTNADYPDYDAAATTENSCAITIVGGGAGEAMRIGILDSISVEP